MEEFFDLKLRHLTVDAYKKRFLELLTYAGYIKDEKVKIQRFLSGLLTFYRDKIQHGMPKTLKEVNRKEFFFYILDTSTKARIFPRRFSMFLTFWYKI